MATHNGSADRPGGWRAFLRGLTWLWTCFWGTVVLICLFIAAAQWTGLDPAPNYGAALGGVMIAIFGAGMTTFGVVRLRGPAVDRPRRAAAPSGQPSPARLSRRAGTPRSLPQAGSVAREPMRRLAAAEGALGEVLYQLDELGADSEMRRDWTADARDAATNAAAELRATAVRLEAVEVAARHAATADRDSLRADIRELRAKLDRGVEAYGALIAAACRVLIADAPAGSRSELTDATDRLAALATALREVSPPE